jgi:hypothetical protein
MGIIKNAKSYWIGSPNGKTFKLEMSYAAGINKDLNFLGTSENPSYANGEITLEYKIESGSTGMAAQQPYTLPKDKSSYPHDGKYHVTIVRIEDTGEEVSMKTGAAGEWKLEEEDK